MEEQNKIFITVSGLSGSGKARMTYLVKQFLKEKGFDVKFDGNNDFKTEEQFDFHMNRNLDEVIGLIKSSREIIVEETTLPRYQKDNA